MSLKVVLEEEYPHLGDFIYVDYAGSMPMCKSQTRKLDELTRECLANPHSSGQISRPISEMEDLRGEICDLFGTNLGEYSVIFTQNTTHAIQLLGDSLPFGSNSAFYYLIDNHNSIFGMRTLAKQKGSLVETVYGLPNASPNHFNFFAFPMQSNLSGKKYPTEWVTQFQNQGGYVLYDSASTCTPDLSVIKPDFVTASLLKLTGIHGGFLMVRRDRISMIKDPLPAGGNILFSCARTGDYSLLPVQHQKMESGTPSYINLSLALEGIRVRRKLGTEAEISRRMQEIGDYFEKGMRSFKHDNGKELIRFQPEREPGFGSTFSFNMYDRRGNPMPAHDVQYCFSVFGISARFGGHCNPGSSFPALGWDPKEIAEVAEKNEESGRCISNLCSVSEKPLGTIRVSFGASSSLEDAQRLLELLGNQFLNGGPCPKELAPLPVPISIKKIFVYPITGAIGFETNKWEFDQKGLRYDRGWKLVNPDGGLVATTHCPKLSSLEAIIDGSDLLLRYPKGEFRVPIDNFEEDKSVPPVVTKRGRVYGPDVRKFLFQAIGRYVFLVRVADREPGRMAFSAIGEESLKWVDNNIDVRRFRTNLILSGVPAFGEEGIISDGLKIGKLGILNWKWRIICMTTSIEPMIGTISREPLIKLSKARGRDGAVALGVLFAVDCQGQSHEITTNTVIDY